MRSLLLLAALALSGAAAAQPSVSISGLAAIPQGEFDDALGSIGGGGALTVLYAAPGSPIALGVEGAIAIYGYERRRAPLSLTIPDVRVGVTTTNNLAQGLAVLRLQVPHGGVRPYVDGVAGLTYLFTETSVSDDDYYYDDGYGFSTVNFDDLALTAGGGVGVLIELHSGYSDEGRPMAVSLDARLRYLSGGSATYLARGDIERTTDGDLYIAPRRSRTDLLVPHVGVSVSF